MNNTFPEQIPDFYRQLIDWNNLTSCPLARMLVTSEQEKNLVAGENADPIGDHVDEVLPGLIHRYPTKVLLISTSHCAGHCRFCFRRASDFTQEEVILDFDRIKAYLQSQPQVNEFIFSGGDPLLISPKKLSQLKALLLSLPQIKIVRWHSRLPVFNPLVLSPARATDFFDFPGKQIVLVIHINHPQEISPAFADLIQTLQRNFPTLILKSQSVLLRGVNADRPDTFVELCTKLHQLGIKPYRIYHLDQAPGISHFRVSITRGLDLYHQLQTLLPPAALPEYYLDLPAGRGKVPVISLRPLADHPHQYQACNHLHQKIIYTDLTS